MSVPPVHYKAIEWEARAAFSADHRAIDGATATLSLGALQRRIEETCNLVPAESGDRCVATPG